MNTLIYKIATRSDWEAAETSGCYGGSSVDRQDGFIHFSTAEQLRETAQKHFAGQSDLLLVAVEAERLDEALKWEISRGGARFPHLYGPLMLNQILSVCDLPLAEDGTAHLFPDEMS